MATKMKAAPKPRSANRIAKDSKIATPARPSKPTSSVCDRAAREKEAEIFACEDELRQATALFKDLKTDAIEARGHQKTLQERFNLLVHELREIRRGNFTPSLPFGKGDARDAKRNGAKTNGHAAPPTDSTPAAVDQGASQPLSALWEFKDKNGNRFLTQSKIDIVKDTIGGATVGDLEKFQREHAFDWREKCKGLGQQGGDKLLDAQAAFRRKFPVPDQVLTESEKAASAGVNSEPAQPPQAAGGEKTAVSLPAGKLEMTPLQKSVFDIGVAAGKLGRDISYPAKMSDADRPFWQAGYDSERAAAARK